MRQTAAGSRRDRTGTTAGKSGSGRSLARARPVTGPELARLRELHGAGLSCRAIAKEMGRAPVTISRHAAELGLSFDRTQVKAATEARVADMAAVRAEVGAQFLTIVQGINTRVLAMLADPEMKPWGLRDMSTAAGHFFDRHLAQIAVDADHSGVSEVDRWLEAMTGRKPPPSRDETDDISKQTSLLGSLMESIVAKHGDEDPGQPGS